MPGLLEPFLPQVWISIRGRSREAQEVVRGSRTLVDGSMGTIWMPHWLAFMTSLAVRQTNAYDPFFPRHKSEIMGARLPELL